jgi:hypothetical protein
MNLPWTGPPWMTRPILREDWSRTGPPIPKRDPVARVLSSTWRNLLEAVFDSEAHF